MLLVVMDAVSAILAVGKKLTAAGASGDCDFALMFDEAGLPARLEELHNHAQDDVYTRAMGIIETYFSEDAGDDAATHEQSAPQGVSFSFGGTSAPFAGFGAVPGGFGTAPAALPAAQVAAFGMGYGGGTHGVGAGVAPVQLFASPASGSGGPGGSMPPPALPPSMFSFDAVSFV